MTKVRIRDTTAHADYGQLRGGEVYDLPGEFAAHLKDIGLAATAHDDTETYHEKQARLAEEAPEQHDEAPVTNPDIERQVREAGTRPGDQDGSSVPTRRPLHEAPSAPRRGR